MENNNQILVLRDKRPTNKLRQRVINRDRQCVVCGFDVAVILEVHHIIPISKGGTNNLMNLVTVCPNCHAAIHKLNENKPLEYKGSNAAALYGSYTIEQIIKLNSLCNL